MLRYITRPRWWVWHVFCVAVVIGCLWASWWQWKVATAPPIAGVDTNAWRNWAYAVNWVIFAGIGVWFWWRLMRDQRRSDIAEGRWPTEGADSQPPAQGADSQPLASSAKATIPSPQLHQPSARSEPAAQREPETPAPQPGTSRQQRFDLFGDDPIPPQR